MRENTAVVRVSRRAHTLANALTDEGNIRRTIEFALELALAMQAWEKEVPAATMSVGEGPLSGEASTRLTAHHAIIADRIFERAVARGIDAYRAEKFFEEKAAVSDGIAPACGEPVDGAPGAVADSSEADE